MSAIVEHKCFLVNIAKFLGVPNLKNICERLPLKDLMYKVLEDLMKV